MKNIISRILAFSAVLAVFSSFKPVFNNGEEEVNILIITNLGQLKVKLYNKTPLHRDNFIKLVEKGFYDSLLFHRVIQSFMIQGGDPDSKYAKDGAMLGNGGTGYTIPAEFNPKLYHKKGVLAAARQGDDVNPKKESSGSQFYIVQGKTYSNADLNIMEARVNTGKKQALFQQLIEKPENAAVKQKFMGYMQQGKQDSLQLYSQQVIDPMVQKELDVVGAFKYSEEQRKAYSTIGGSPQLDGGYTVFGEVTEGLEVIDKIAAVPRDGNNRPLQNVRMKVSIVKSKQ